MVFFSVFVTDAQKTNTQAGALQFVQKSLDAFAGEGRSAGLGWD
jgi:hypothetical protein